MQQQELMRQLDAALEGLLPSITYDERRDVAIVKFGESFQGTLLEIHTQLTKAGFSVYVEGETIVVIPKDGVSDFSPADQSDSVATLYDLVDDSPELRIEQVMRVLKRANYNVPLDSAWSSYVPQRAGALISKLIRFAPKREIFQDELGRLTKKLQERFRREFILRKEGEQNFILYISLSFEGDQRFRWARVISTEVQEMLNIIKAPDLPGLTEPQKDALFELPFKPLRKYQKGKMQLYVQEIKTWNTLRYHDVPFQFQPTFLLGFNPAFYSHHQHVLTRQDLKGKLSDAYLDHVLPNGMTVFDFLQKRCICRSLNTLEFATRDLGPFRGRRENRPWDVNRSLALTNKILKEGNRPRTGAADAHAQWFDGQHGSGAAAFLGCWFIFKVNPDRGASYIIGQNTGNVGWKPRDLVRSFAKRQSEEGVFPAYPVLAEMMFESPLAGMKKKGSLKSNQSPIKEVPVGSLLAALYPFPVISGTKVAEEMDAGRWDFRLGDYETAMSIFGELREIFDQFHDGWYKPNVVEVYRLVRSDPKFRGHGYFAKKVSPEALPKRLFNLLASPTLSQRDVMEIFAACMYGKRDDQITKGRMALQDRQKTLRKALKKLFVEQEKLFPFVLRKDYPDYQVKIPSFVPPLLRKAPECVPEVLSSNFRYRLEGQKGLHQLSLES